MFQFMIFVFFLIEKFVLTKKSQKKMLICVSEFVVVISGCKIEFYFYNWVVLGHNFRLGLDMVGQVCGASSSKWAEFK